MDKVALGVDRDCGCAKGGAGEGERFLDDALVAFWGAEFAHKSSLPGIMALGILIPFLIALVAKGRFDTEGENSGAPSLVDGALEDAFQYMSSSECDGEGDLILDFDRLDSLLLLSLAENPNPNSPLPLTDFERARLASLKRVFAGSGCDAGSMASSKRTLNCFFPIGGLAGVSSMNVSPPLWAGPSSSLESASLNVRAA